MANAPGQVLERATAVQAPPIERTPGAQSSSTTETPSRPNRGERSARSVARQEKRAAKDARKEQEWQAKRQKRREELANNPNKSKALERYEARQKKRAERNAARYEARRYQERRVAEVSARSRLQGLAFGALTSVTETFGATWLRTHRLVKAMREHGVTVLTNEFVLAAVKKAGPEAIESAATHAREVGQSQERIRQLAERMGDTPEGTINRVVHQYGQKPIERLCQELIAPILEGRTLTPEEQRAAVQRVMAEFPGNPALANLTAEDLMAFTVMGQEMAARGVVGNDPRRREAAFDALIYRGKDEYRLEQLARVSRFDILNASPYVKGLVLGALGVTMVANFPVALAIGAGFTLVASIHRLRLDRAMRAIETQRGQKNIRAKQQITENMTWLQRNMTRLGNAMNVDWEESGYTSRDYASALASRIGVGAVCSAVFFFLPHAIHDPAGALNDIKSVPTNISQGAENVLQEVRHVFQGVPQGDRASLNADASLLGNVERAIFSNPQDHLQQIAQTTVPGKHGGLMANVGNEGSDTSAIDQAMNIVNIRAVGQELGNLASGHTDLGQVVGAVDAGGRVIEHAAQTVVRGAGDIAHTISTDARTNVEAVVSGAKSTVEHVGKIVQNPDQLVSHTPELHQVHNGEYITALNGKEVQIVGLPPGTHLVEVSKNSYELVLDSNPARVIAYDVHIDSGSSFDPSHYSVGLDAHWAVPMDELNPNFHGVNSVGDVQIANITHPNEVLNMQNLNSPGVPKGGWWTADMTADKLAGMSHIVQDPHLPFAMELNGHTDFTYQEINGLHYGLFLDSSNHHIVGAIQLDPGKINATDTALNEVALHPGSTVQANISYINLSNNPVKYDVSDSQISLPPGTVNTLQSHISTIIANHQETHISVSSIHGGFNYDYATRVNPNPFPAGNGDYYYTTIHGYSYSEVDGLQHVLDFTNKNGEIPGDFPGGGGLNIPLPGISLPAPVGGFLRTMTIDHPWILLNIASIAAGYVGERLTYGKYKTYAATGIGGTAVTVGAGIATHTFMPGFAVGFLVSRFRRGKNGGVQQQNNQQQPNQQGGGQPKQPGGGLLSRFPWIPGRGKGGGANAAGGATPPTTPPTTGATTQATGTTPQTQPLYRRPAGLTTGNVSAIQTVPANPPARGRGANRAQEAAQKAEQNLGNGITPGQVQTARNIGAAAASGGGDRGQVAHAAVEGMEKIADSQDTAVKAQALDLSVRRNAEILAAATGVPQEDIALLADQIQWTYAAHQAIRSYRESLNGATENPQQMANIALQAMEAADVIPNKKGTSDAAIALRQAEILEREIGASHRVEIQDAFAPGHYTTESRAVVAAFLYQPSGGGNDEQERIEAAFDEAGVFKGTVNNGAAASVAKALNEAFQGETMLGTGSDRRDNIIAVVEAQNGTSHALNARVTAELTPGGKQAQVDAAVTYWKNKTNSDQKEIAAIADQLEDMGIGRTLIDAKFKGAKPATGVDAAVDEAKSNKSSSNVEKIRAGMDRLPAPGNPPKRKPEDVGTALARMSRDIPGITAADIQQYVESLPNLTPTERAEIAAAALKVLTENGTKPADRKVLEIVVAAAGLKDLSGQTLGPDDDITRTIVELGLRIKDYNASGKSGNPVDKVNQVEDPAKELNEILKLGSNRTIIAEAVLRRTMNESAEVRLEHVLHIAISDAASAQEINEVLEAVQKSPSWKGATIAKDTLHTLVSGIEDTEKQAVIFGRFVDPGSDGVAKVTVDTLLSGSKEPKDVVGVVLGLRRIKQPNDKLGKAMEGLSLDPSVDRLDLMREAQRRSTGLSEKDQAEVIVMVAKPTIDRESFDDVSAVFDFLRGALGGDKLPIISNAINLLEIPLPKRIEFVEKYLKDNGLSQISDYDESEKNNKKKQENREKVEKDIDREVRLALAMVGSLDVSTLSGQKGKMLDMIRDVLKNKVTAKELSNVISDVWRGIITTPSPQPTP